MMRQVEEMDSIDSLLHRHHQIYHTEVVLESMTNEDAATVHKEPQLLVGRLQCGEVLGREVGVKIPRLDPGELGQVVHDLLLSRDVVVNEGHPLHPTLSPDTGNPSHAHVRRLHRRHLAVTPQLRLLLVQGDELGINGHEISFLGHLLRPEGCEGGSLDSLHHVLVLGEDVHIDGVAVLEVLERPRHLLGGEAQDTGHLPLEVEPGGFLLRDGGDREVVEDIPLGDRGAYPGVVGGTNLQTVGVVAEVKVEVREVGG